MGLCWLCRMIRVVFTALAGVALPDGPDLIAGFAIWAGLSLSDGPGGLCRMGRTGFAGWTGWLCLM
jgi:hypothetical protein